MSGEEIRRRTQAVWDRFYSLKFIWKRSSFLKLPGAAWLRFDLQAPPADECQ